MQVEINAINAVSKEINITVPAERTDKAYEKYIRKASKDIAVPGFRKGKAPLAMVERMHADTIRDYFLKDFVDEVFDEAAKEHDIHFLLFPEVKDITWEKGSEMIIKIEVEHEPKIEFKQLEGLSIPHQPQLLEDEVEKYLQGLVKDNGHVVDVETAVEDDEISAEISFKHGSESFSKTGTLYAGSGVNNRSLAELIGCKTGDVVEAKLPGRAIMLAVRDAGLPLEKDFAYSCNIMVNSISRMQYPAIDDEFAKDMEFDSLEAMKTKIADDMKLRNEHININIDNYSVISKLYVDNNFELPYKTIEYLAEQEAAKVDNPDYRKFYIYQYKMQIAQEMISMYVMNSLRQAVPMEVSDEMMAEYITHEAILEDKSVEAYKEQNADYLGQAEYKLAVQNYFILRQIANSSDFFVPEPEAETEIPETETEAVETTEE